MPDIPISQADIDRLAGRLSELEPQLTADERALLAGIFRAAAQVMESAEKVLFPPGTEPDPVFAVRDATPRTPLKTQFETAFSADPDRTLPSGAGSVGRQATGSVGRQAAGGPGKGLTGAGSVARASIGRTATAAAESGGGPSAAAQAPEADDRPASPGA